MLNWSDITDPITDAVHTALQTGIKLTQIGANITKDISPMAGDLITDSVDNIAPYVETFSQEFVAEALQQALQNPTETLAISMMFFNPTGDKQPFLDKFWGIALQSAGVAVLGTGAQTTQSQEASNEAMKISDGDSKQRFQDYVKNDPDFKTQAQAKSAELDAMLADDDDFADLLRELHAVAHAEPAAAQLRRAS